MQFLFLEIMMLWDSAVVANLIGADLILLF